MATPFSPLNPMGAICCHGNQSFDPIWPKTYCSLSPIPMMLLIKFHCGWPTGCRDYMFEIVDDDDDDKRTTDHGYTKSSPSSLLLRWANNLKNFGQRFNISFLYTCLITALKCHCLHNIFMTFYLSEWVNNIGISVAMTLHLIAW